MIYKYLFCVSGETTPTQGQAVKGNFPRTHREVGLFLDHLKILASERGVIVPKMLIYTLS